MVCAKLKAKYLESRLLDQLHSSIQLSQFMVTGTRVGEDFHPVQTHQSVRATEGKRQAVTLCGLADATHEAGVKSSSNSSTPITVSSVETTASPKGTKVCHPEPLLSNMLKDKFVACRMAHLPSDIPDDGRQRMFLCLTMLIPRSEMTQLSLD